MPILLNPLSERLFPMSENGSNDLSERIAAARRARAEREGQNPDEVEQTGTSAGAMALRFGAEFGVSVAVGIGIGLLIDYYAGSKPWGLLIMMMFGFAAGIRSVMRAYRELNAEAAKLAENGSVGPDKEEKTT